MFAILGTAIADELNSKYPANEKHPFLAFVVAEDDSNAIAIYSEELAGHNWKEPTCDRMKIISDDFSKENDETIQGAHNQAKETGFSVVIYSEPIKEGS